MNLKPLVVALLIVVAGVGPAAAATATTESTQSGDAYAGTHVEFEAEGSAVSDYAVNDDVVLEEIVVQSASEVESDGELGAGAGLGGDASVAGAEVAVTTRAETSATVESESGAEMEAHDNERGVLVVTSGDGEQYVHANVSGDGEAEADSDDRVVVETEGDTEGTFIVVGEGNVTVDGEGNVSATVGEDGQLVYRQYDGERSDEEEQQERMIANGTAVAEVYYQQASDDSEDDSERAADVVEYGQDTTVEVTERSANRVNMTVERTESEGKVVIATISESAMESADELEVYVDGEAAAEASSYGDVRSAADGDEPRYLVRQSSSAEAATEVVIGIDHFSQREVSMQSGADGGDSVTGAGPGFGVIAAVAALGATLLVRRRL